MVIALQGGDIIYYELDENGDLAEVEQTSLDDEVVDCVVAPSRLGPPISLTHLSHFGSPLYNGSKILEPYGGPLRGLLGALPS